MTNHRKSDQAHHPVDLADNVVHEVLELDPGLGALDREVVELVDRGAGSPEPSHGGVFFDEFLVEINIALERLAVVNPGVSAELLVKSGFSFVCRRLAVHLVGDGLG